MRKEEQIQDALSSGIIGSKVEMAKLVTNKAKEFQKILEEIRMAEKTGARMMNKKGAHNKMLNVASRGPSPSIKPKRSNMSLLSYTSAGQNMSPKEEIKYLQEKRIKLAPYYTATLEDLGFSDEHEKKEFDYFFAEYIDDTLMLLKRVCNLILKMEASPNEILISYTEKCSLVLSRRIDICILVLYRLNPYVVTQNRPSVFEKVNIIQLVMSSIDQSQVREFYSIKTKSQWDVEMTNLVLNKNENDEEVDRTFDLLLFLESMVQLTPDLFINTEDKFAWRILFSDKFSCNLAKIVDLLQEKYRASKSQEIDPILTENICKVARVNLVLPKISLNDFITLTDEISLLDISCFSDDHLKIKLVKEAINLSEEDKDGCILGLSSVMTLENMSALIEIKYKKEYKTEKDLKYLSILRVNNILDLYTCGYFLLNKNDGIIKLKPDDKYDDFDPFEFYDQDPLDSSLDSKMDEDFNSVSQPGGDRLNMIKEIAKKRESLTPLSKIEDLDPSSPQSKNFRFKKHTTYSNRSPNDIEEKDEELNASQDIELKMLYEQKFLCIDHYHSKSPPQSMRALKKKLLKFLTQKHGQLKRTNLSLEYLKTTLKIKQEFCESLHVKAKVSIDGCKRERYLSKIQEMNGEINELYNKLQEQEQLFANGNNMCTIDSIKELLLEINCLEAHRDSIQKELTQKEKMWIKNDEVYKQSRDRLILIISLEINLLIDRMKYLFKIRDVQYKSILYFEKLLLSINSLEMEERRKNLKYYSEAKDIIFNKEQRLYDLKVTSESLKARVLESQKQVFDLESKIG
ncbi:unnamed protein product [Moneuplotes crassus]|uniref:Uncharacterized protein n=1 Tax=Euplotes crassus TaxID=5936 RepID=A0AAD2D946_EUPCR|nr:unnamed protein product [Moneuplotes crassus]